jgi:hypothetical protein
MTKCLPLRYQFSKLKNRQVKVQFSGGALLLREADRKLGITNQLAKLFPNQRKQNKVTHSLLTMLKQRIYGIVLGYEGLNDHSNLRNCPALQTTVGVMDNMASPYTLCRLESQADRKFAVEAHRIMIDNFIASFRSQPRQLILDFGTVER